MITRGDDGVMNQMGLAPQFDSPAPCGSTPPRRVDCGSDNVQRLPLDGPAPSAEGWSSERRSRAREDTGNWSRMGPRVAAIGGACISEAIASPPSWGPTWEAGRARGRTHATRPDHAAHLPRNWDRYSQAQRPCCYVGPCVTLGVVGTRVSDECRERRTNARIGRWRAHMNNNHPRTDARRHVGTRALGTPFEPDAGGRRRCRAGHMRAVLASCGRRRFTVMRIRGYKGTVFCTSPPGVESPFSQAIRYAHAKPARSALVSRNTTGRPALASHIVVEESQFAVSEARRP